MRSLFRCSFSVVLAAIFIAVGTANNVFAQGRSRAPIVVAPAAESAKPAAQPAATPATPPQTPPAPKPGTLTIVTSTLPDGEATRVYEAKIEVKGGKPPYAYVVSTSSGADVGVNEDNNIVFTADEEGTVEFTFQVQDSSEPKLEAGKKFSVRVNPKKWTPLEIIEEARQGLATVEAVNDALATKAGKSQLEELTKVVNGHTLYLDQQAKTAGTYKTILLVILILVGLVVAVFFYLRKRGKGKGTGTGTAGVILLALFASSQMIAAPAPATPKVVCGDSQFLADFFQADGTAQEVVCLGLKGSKVETTDPKVTVSDVKQTPRGLSFKLTPANDANLDYLELKVDDKSIGQPIEIVSPAEFRTRDRAITSLTQVLRHQGGVGGGVSKSDDMRWMAFFNAVCGTEKSRARCGREFGSPITGAELFAQLRKARTQAEEDAVMAQLARAAEFNATDRVFSDPRLEAAIVGGVKAGLGVALGPVEAKADEALAKATAVDRRVDEVVKEVSGLQASIKEAIQKAADLEGGLEALGETRVPRRGPLGALGITRRLAR